MDFSLITETSYHYFYSAILQAFAALIGLIVFGIIYRYQDWDKRHKAMMGGGRKKVDEEAMKVKTFNEYKPTLILSIGLIAYSAAMLIFVNAYSPYTQFVFFGITWSVILVCLVSYYIFIKKSLT